MPAISVRSGWKVLAAATGIGTKLPGGQNRSNVTTTRSEAFIVEHPGESR